MVWRRGAGSRRRGIGRPEFRLVKLRHRWPSTDSGRHSLVFPTTPERKRIEDSTRTADWTPDCGNYSPLKVAGALIPVRGNRFATIHFGARRAAVIFC